jgi:hypothetical protein
MKEKKLIELMTQAARSKNVVTISELQQRLGEMVNPKHDISGPAFVVESDIDSDFVKAMRNPTEIPARARRIAVRIANSQEKKS